MKEIKVSKEIANQRADKFVKKYLNEAPLSFVYKLFRKKDVKINGHWIKENYILNEGEILNIYITDAQYEEFNKPKSIEDLNNQLDIVYEDSNILIVNKPKGLLVQGDDKEKTYTLTNFVRSYLYKKGEFKNDGIEFAPSPVHRLDRNTSGICIFAKNLYSSQEMMDLFKEHDDIDKYYLALTKGFPSQEKGMIDVPLLKNEDTKIVKVSSLKNGAKSAKTEYEVLSKNNELSLLKVHLLTGRTHQIRVHLNYINCPIVGDQKYGDFKYNKQFEKEFDYNNQFLHAYKFKFKEISGTLSYLSNKEFVCDFSKKEKDILSKLNIKYKLKL